MGNIDFEALRQDNDFYIDLGDGVWLMDNHKWALYAWEFVRLQEGIPKFTLVHADYHWDGGYDVYDDPEMEEKLLGADLEQLREIIEEEEWVRYDSFIAPAVAKGMFDAVHFFCKQDDGSDIGISEDVRRATGTQQEIHGTADSLASLDFSYPLIFDLCLDLFNKSDMFQQGDLWSDAEVIAFLETERPLITSAALITVSLSFDCSGTPDDTRHLASLVLPKIQAWRTLIAA